MPEPISPQPTTPTIRIGTVNQCKTRQLVGISGFDVRPLLLGSAGLLLTFSAPPHRLDLLAVGVIALFGALLWQPRTGPLLIGAALPFFFFGRPLVGPLSVSPPGLVLLLAWPVTLIQAARRSIVLRWPTSSFNAAGIFQRGLARSVVANTRCSRANCALILDQSSSSGCCAQWRSETPGAGGFRPLRPCRGAASCRTCSGTGGTEPRASCAQAWYPSPNHLALMLGRAWPFLPPARSRSAHPGYRPRSWRGPASRFNWWLVGVAGDSRDPGRAGRALRRRQRRPLLVSRVDWRRRFSSSD
jgi:hypothetical protein